MARREGLSFLGEEMDKTQELKDRVNRVNYLVKKAESLLNINNEQVEAYTQRINWHKQKILAIMEERKGK